MTNKTALRRHLAGISEALSTMAVLIDIDLVGDDARHLESDVKAAQRELNTIDADSVSTPADLAYLRDRLRHVRSAVNVVANTLHRLEQQINAGMDSLDNAADTVADSSPSQDE
jgi:septal ring factor EnvC (AmiA/AmiB activator)